VSASDLPFREGTYTLSFSGAHGVLGPDGSAVKACEFIPGVELSVMVTVRLYQAGADWAGETQDPSVGGNLSLRLTRGPLDASFLASPNAIGVSGHANGIAVNTVALTNISPAETRVELGTPGIPARLRGGMLRQASVVLAGGLVDGNVTFSDGRDHKVA